MTASNQKHCSAVFLMCNFYNCQLLKFIICQDSGHVILWKTLVTLIGDPFTIAEIWLQFRKYFVIIWHIDIYMWVNRNRQKSVSKSAFNNATPLLYLWVLHPLDLYSVVKVSALAQSLPLSIHRADFKLQQLDPSISLFSHRHFHLDFVKIFSTLCALFSRDSRPPPPAFCDNIR